MLDDGQLRLDDSRIVDPAALLHLPPLEPMPSKIIAVHLSYSSRGIESRNKPKSTEKPNRA